MGAAILYGAALSALWSFGEVGNMFDNKKPPTPKPVNQRKARKKARRRKK